MMEVIGFIALTSAFNPKAVKTILERDHLEKTDEEKRFQLSLKNSAEKLLDNFFNRQ